MNNIQMANNLLQRVRNSLDIAETFELDIARMEMDDAMGRRKISEIPEEAWHASEGLESHLQMIVRDLKSLCDLLGLKSLLDEISSVRLLFEDELGKIEYSHELYDMHCPFLLFCQRVFASLASTLNTDVSSGLDTFTTILKNTAIILKDVNEIPSNETKVSNAVFKILKFAFHDAVKPTIPQFTKSYKPDLGVVGLRAAAEYKFITDEEKLKVAIGGIYEDINGYAGSADWEVFYSVFYIDGTVSPFEKIEAEFQKTGVPDNWHLIPVHGPSSKH